MVVVVVVVILKVEEEAIVPSAMSVSIREAASRAHTCSASPALKSGPGTPTLVRFVK